MTATCQDCKWDDAATYSRPAAEQHADETGHSVLDE